MVMVLKRIDEIYQREGFMIEPRTRKGKALTNLKRNGVLKAYPFRKKLKDSSTVNDWITERFEASNPGYSCKVLDSNGNIVPGQTLLKTVRATY
jgi:hypothetical protein